jgi:acetylornithine deacetylase/succinyl-diaminopimelate desuccinylase family protein
MLYRQRTVKPVVELLQQLVSIPSVNPALADDPSIGGEARLTKWLAEDLKRRGFRVEWHEQTAGRPNVVGRYGPEKPGRTVLLESHLDTQGIHQMIVPPFDGEVRDGRLYGRGACDTKGPMAAALMALDRATLERLANAGVQVIYVGAMGEEKGNIGAEELVEGGLGADQAIVLEPTDLNIVHAHKGALWFEVEVEGLAAHGSNPSLGVNAIRGMAMAIDAIQALTDAHAARREHNLLGRATVNVGVIRGGSSINIVPDRCVIQVDRRTLPGDDHEALLREIGQALDQLKARGVFKAWRLHKIKEGVPFETTAESALVRGMLDACRRCGVESRAEGAPWYSDAGPFSRTCREVAVFGPGSIAQAHTIDEYIELASLEKGVEILHAYLNGLVA